MEEKLCIYTAQEGHGVEKGRLRLPIAMSRPLHQNGEGLGAVERNQAWMRARGQAFGISRLTSAEARLLSRRFEQGRLCRDRNGS